jgi:hypothetical protein
VRYIAIYGAKHHGQKLFLFLAMISGHDASAPLDNG